MNRFYQLCLFLVTLSLISCENKLKTTQNFWVDNPLEKEITVTIDDKDYNIPASSGVMVTLESGVHNLKYDGQQIKFLSKKCNQGVLLNPTLSNYVLGYNAFFDKDDLVKGNEQLEQIAKGYLFDYEFEPGVVGKAPFKLANGLFIEQYEYFWNFDVANSFPSVLTVDRNSTSLGVVIQSKLFREREYLEFAKDMLPNEFTFPKNNQKLSELPAFTLVTQEMYPECSESKYIGDEVNARFDSLKISSGDEFNKILFRLEQMSYDTRIINYRLKDPCEEGYFKKIKAIDKAIRSVGERSAFVIG